MRHCNHQVIGIVGAPMILHLRKQNYTTVTGQPNQIKIQIFNNCLYRMVIK